MTSFAFSLIVVVDEVVDVVVDVVGFVVVDVVDAVVVEDVVGFIVDVILIIILLIVKRARGTSKPRVDTGNGMMPNTQTNDLFAQQSQPQNSKPPE